MGVKLIIKNTDFKKNEFLSKYVWSLIKSSISTVIDNEEFSYVIVDNDNRILYSIDVEGNIYKADIADDELDKVVEYFIENPPTAANT